MERITAHATALSDGIWRVASLTLGGILVLVGFYYVRFGALNADEGFYLLSARFVAEGLVPYRDFGITQPPGFPWIYSYLLQVFGWNLFGIRMAGFVLMLASVFLAARSLVRQRGWREVAILFALLLVSPGWISFCTTGKTYALAGLAVTAGVITLASPGSLVVRWWFFVLFAALGTVTRLPTLAFFLPASLYLLHAIPTWKLRVTSLLGATSIAAVVVVLASGGDWDSAYFWTTKFHASVGAVRPFSIRFYELLEIAPAVFLLLPVCWFAPRVERLVPGAMFSLAAATVMNIATQTTYGEYTVPFVAPAAYLIAISTRNFLGRFRNRNISCWVCAAFGLLAATAWSNPPTTAPQILDDAAGAANYLRASVPPSQYVVATLPEITVAADRRVPASVAMGKFSLTESLSEEDALRYGMVTPGQLDALLATEEVGALVLCRYPSWNFNWSLPDLSYTSQATIDKIAKRTTSSFRLGYANAMYVVFVREPKPIVEEE